MVSELRGTNTNTLRKLGHKVSSTRIISADFWAYSSWPGALLLCPATTMLTNLLFPCPLPLPLSISHPFSLSQPLDMLYFSPFNLVFGTFFAHTSSALVHSPSRSASGADKVSEQIKEMLGFRPGIFWRTCWAFISPMFLFVSSEFSQLLGCCLLHNLPILSKNK